MTKEEFTHAYYRLARRFHPDRNDGATLELMARINEARALILKDIAGNERRSRARIGGWRSFRAA